MHERATQPISPRLLRALDETAATFRGRGVRLFVFGSIARTYPLSHRGADLDIGWEREPGAPVDDDVARSLARAMESLPTVRPVDLVDFATVSPDFARQAKAHTIDLPVARP